MTIEKAGQDQVVIDRALLAQLLESGERMLDGMTKLVEGLHTASVVVDDEIEPVAPAAPAEARVWDTSEDALANYDAEQLVALRGDHRADNHDVAGCRVCDVLVRRLGTL